jgi:hypothetical protein
MFTQKFWKILFITFMVIGGIAILFPLFSSTTGAGMGMICFFIALIIYVANKKSIGQGRSRRALGIIALVGIMPLFSFGCTLKVPMTPTVGKLEIKEKLPVEAGLLITEETKKYTFRGNPESFTARNRPHEFPLGQALATASLQTFSQVFQKLTLVSTPKQAQNYRIVIEPKIEDFHFRYDQLSYAGFAIAVLSKIKVRVTLASGETKIFERTLESPEQKKGPWVVNFSYEEKVGESASEALVFTLGKIATEITENESVKKIAATGDMERKREEKPTLVALPASARKELPKIAVWDLVHRNISEDYAHQLTDILGSEVTKLGKYEVYSQENVRTLAGWEAQKMMLGCTDTKCLTALGQMDIGKLISGSVGKIGNTYSISLSLFDTVNVRSENKISEECGSENELISLVRRSARKLLNLE